MGTQPPTDPQCDTELDLSNSSKGIWLVKVPKNIAKQWKAAPGGMDVGKLKITRQPGEKLEAQLSLSEALLELKVDGKKSTRIPKEHRMLVSSMKKQCLGVFSEVVDTSDLPHTSGSVQGKLCLEGKVVHKLTCMPCADDKYYKHKAESIKQALMPTRLTQQLHRPVLNFAPEAKHKHHKKREEKRREEAKRLREEP